jgi:hypothetical protein
MKFLNGEIEVPINFEGPPTHKGFFGVATRKKKMISWYSCRDTYQTVKKDAIKTNGIYFSHPKNKGEGVAFFLNGIEDILKIKTKSKFSKTERDNVLWIKISDWWLKTKTRRSFLTLMLRVGMDHEPGQPVMDTITTSSRISYTLPAIERFLEGYTASKKETTAATNGWFQMMNGLDENKVKEVLVKRIIKKRKK